MENPTFTEAPASATMRIDYKGYDILFTLRDVSGAELLKKIEGAVAHFDKAGIKPANGKPATLAAVGDGPMCPAHNKPMKPGRNGGFYCPVKLLDDDGSGKPVYCKHKA
jgi:hypothetical protein